MTEGRQREETKGRLGRAICLPVLKRERPGEVREIMRLFSTTVETPPFPHPFLRLLLHLEKSTASRPLRAGYGSVTGETGRDGRSSGNASR